MYGKTTALSEQMLHLEWKFYSGKLDRQASAGMFGFESFDKE